MERKLNTNEIPFQAQRLYIKLYCERKGEQNKKTVREAKKSWISLNVLEKKQFQKTSKQRNFLKYANSISKTELFVKKKPHRDLDKSQIEGLDNEGASLPPEVSLNESDIADQRSQLSPGDIIAVDIIDDTRQTKTELDSHEPHDMQILSQPCNESNIEVINETQSDFDNNQEANVGSPITCNEKNETKMDVVDTHSESNSNQGSVAVSLAEPEPPTVKIGRDLYDMIKPPGDTNWMDMTKKERNFYNSAVRALKKDYIKKYTIFLESLSQQQLYDHYMKTLKS